MNLLDRPRRLRATPVLRDMLAEAEQALQDGSMEAARVIVDNRVNGLGVTEPLVQLQGSDHIIVELPPGDHEVTLSLVRRPLRRGAELFSFGALIFLLYLIYRTWKTPKAGRTAVVTITALAVFLLFFRFWPDHAPLHRPASGRVSRTGHLKHCLCAIHVRSHLIGIFIRFKG